MIQKDSIFAGTGWTCDILFGSLHLIFVANNFETYTNGWKGVPSKIDGNDGDVFIMPSSGKGLNSSCRFGCHQDLWTAQFSRCAGFVSTQFEDVDVGRRF